MQKPNWKNYNFYILIYLCVVHTALQFGGACARSDSLLIDPS